jgi:hypothetical protein
MCLDKNNDCVCDGCKTLLCVDTDENHVCEICNKFMCFDGDDIDHNCDVCGLGLCKDGDDTDHLCDVCYDYTCVNCCIQPQIMVFSLGDNCYVNGDKYAKIYKDDYSYQVYPTYTGQRTLIGWKIYDVNENLIFTMLPHGCFTVENEGKYYFVAIFED